MTDNTAHALNSPLAADIAIETVMPGALAEYADLWRTFWEGLPEASPQAHPAWLLPWMETHAPDRSFLLIARRAEAPVAITPAFVWEGRLYLAGTGPSDHASDLWTAEGHDAAGPMLEALAELARAQGCEALELRQLSIDSPLATGPAPGGFASRIALDETCRRLALSGENGLGNVSAGMAKTFAYACRRAERELGMEIVHAREETLEELTQALFALHTARWNSRGEPGVLGDELSEAFTRKAIPALHAAGLLRLTGLKLDGRIAAVIYAIAGRGETAYYLSGFDPEMARYMPGTILVGTTIREAAAEGMTTLDFLRGEEPYKERWGAKAQPRIHRTLRLVR